MEFSTPAVLFLAFIVLQRLSELAIAKRNTAALLKKGAREVGKSHYPFMVALHTAWVLALIFLGYHQAVDGLWLVIFAVLQIFRVWILTSLGSRWTTRIIVLDQPLVTRGPFKYVNHPNYMLVVAEVFVAPMVLGLIWIALLFSALNAVMLWVRISAEERELSKQR